jgi:alanine dehydrogenase
VSDQPLWVGEKEVAELLTLEDAIDVLDGAYRLQARGEASSMRRAHAREGASILHAVGGIIAGRGVTGTKTWTYTPGGASPLVVLFSLSDGRVLGVIEAFALGQMRTAATSGLATRVLARTDAATLALLGTGKQAFEQARAVACVRPLARVRVYGRDAVRRDSLVHRLTDALGVEVSGHADVLDACDGADVVTTVTRAAEPFVGVEALAPGVHVNAVGAIVPSRRELNELAVGACTTIVADSVVQAHDDSGELRAAADAGLLDWARVRGLEDVVGLDVDALRGPGDITLFKALGVGLSDVALGIEVLERAVAAEVGSSLPTQPVFHS